MLWCAGGERGRASTRVAALGPATRCEVRVSRQRDGRVVRWIGLGCRTRGSGFDSNRPDFLEGPLVAARRGSQSPAY
jgi:hypothetical protein